MFENVLFLFALSCIWLFGTLYVYANERGRTVERLYIKTTNNAWAPLHWWQSLFNELSPLLLGLFLASSSSIQSFFLKLFSCFLFLFFASFNTSLGRYLFITVVSFYHFFLLLFCRREKMLCFQPAVLFVWRLLFVVIVIFILSLSLSSLSSYFWTLFSSFQHALYLFCVN